MRNFDKYTNGVSTNAINTLNMYVPRIKVKRTVLKSKGSGLNIIQANKLKIVLSNKDEIIVETLLRNQRNFLFVNLEIFS